MARERFGPYLLLKKLGEDCLGEFFRAGHAHEDSLDQIALLRVLNGEAAAVPDLAQHLRQRSHLQALLRSPNLARGLEVGDFHGVPYVAYEYISGHNLTSLVRLSQRSNQPLPSEQALLIAERLALGLAGAHNSEVGGESIVHGLVVPDLVMISNEGETRLSGFEFSHALRDPANKIETWLGRYLPAEVHAGAPPSSADDVFGVAIILLELLHGSPIVATEPESLNAAIQQVSAQGLPGIAELLQRSVAPADQRIPNMSTWHRSFATLLQENEISSTPFHLAFFMHNLFREEIELESAEIEREKTLDISREIGRPPAITPEEKAPAPVERESGSVSRISVQESYETEDVSSRPTIAGAAVATPEPESARPWRLLAIAAIVLLVVGAGSFFAWRALSANGDGDEIAESGAVTGSAVDASAAQPALDPGDVDPEPAEEATEANTVDSDELLAEIDRIVAQRTDAVESNIRGQYDRELETLRTQLAAAEAEREEERQRAAEIERERLELERQAAAAAEAAKVAEESAAALGEAADGSQITDAEPINEPEAAPVSTPPEAPPAPTVKVGELVELGPGVVQPRVQRRVDPQYPFAAKRLRREADVELEVLVDENGSVIDIRQARNAGFGFDEAAAESARKARYSPATKDGVRVKMWTTLKISFRYN